MISVIRPDMAAKVIEPPKAETQDDKDLGAKWVKFFIIFGGMLAASAAFFAHQVITGGRFLGTSAMLMATRVLPVPVACTSSMRRWWRSAAWQNASTAARWYGRPAMRSSSSGRAID